MDNNNNKKKLSTGIEGLDDLFYGGIHLEQRSNNSDGLLIMARGEHGVNKIHLAMQMCEGLYVSELKESKSSKRTGDDLVEFTPLSQRSNLRFSFPIRMYFLEEAVKRLKEILKKCSEEPEKENEDITKKEKKKRERLRTLYEYCKNDEHYARLCAMKYIDIVFPYHKIVNLGIFNKEGVLDRKVLYKKRKVIIKEMSKIENANKVIDVFLRYSSRNHFSKNYSNIDLLFISLNKDGKLINSLYFDFYIQRLFKKIKTQNDDENAVLLLHNMLWYRDDTCISNNPDLEKTKSDLIDSYAFFYISRLREKENKNKETQQLERGIEKLKSDIKAGYIYYNERTHGIHLRHQTRAEDTGEMLLCKVYIPKESKVTIIGRDELNGDNRMADGLTSFFNMLRILDYYLPDKDLKKKVDFIMIDGLSCLTREEIAQCSFNALSNKLRKACVVSIVTADNKAPTSYADIVIDMAIKEDVNPDQLCNLLRISKCLYQRNAYGWHSYKMRVSGIEVVPSLRFQTITRFLMDNAVADALLPINEDPYPYWLDETSLYEDKNIDQAICDYVGVDLDDGDTKRQIDYHNPKSVLRGVLHYEGILALKTIIEELKNDKYKEHSLLFVDFNLSRTEFKYRYYDMIKQIKQINKEKIHLFSFQPGYLHADEFLWTIDQQVQAILKTIDGLGQPDTHREQIHLIIGDLNYIGFAYPCLNKESLLLPAIASYTKKHHMTNFVYASVSCGSNIKMLDKENEIIRQMCAVVGSDNLTNCLDESRGD